VLCSTWPLIAACDDDDDDDDDDDNSNILTATFNHMLTILFSTNIEMSEMQILA